MTNVLIKGGNLGTDRQGQKKDDVKTTGRRWPCDWSDAFSTQGKPRIVDKYQN
jgi:hypothetical protein